MMYARSVRPVTAASRVRDVMVWPVATLDGSATLSEAAEALAADEIGAVCITEDGWLVGIISERDVVGHVAAGVELDHLTANEVMSTDLVTVAPDDELLTAGRRMIESEVRHLPVTDEGRLAGMLSIRDVFSVLADAADDPSVVVVRSGTRVMVVAE